MLLREIAQRGYLGGQTQLNGCLRTVKPGQAMEPVVRFETALGEQLQVDWGEFRKGAKPLYAFCATLGYSRASYVELVSDMKAQTLVACHEHAFGALGGVPQRVLFDNMKTVVFERDSYGEGMYPHHAGFLDYARHCGFVIKLGQPYCAKTAGKRQSREFQRLPAPLVLRAPEQPPKASGPTARCRDRQHRGVTLAPRGGQPKKGCTAPRKRVRRIGSGTIGRP